jgi:thiamine-phosphate pyrophosphorylase
MQNSAILRILDANCNRAREALRVMEDYARFALDDRELCAGLKELRHGLAAATRDIVDQAILHRDASADVGMDVKTAAEFTRADAAEVVTAAGKRLGEALRSIEEFLKIEQPQTAAEVEKLRYRSYDIEQKLSHSARRGSSFEHVRLYVLITESICTRPWLETVKEAILGGAECLQLREKNLDAGELLIRARKLVELCHSHGTLCIINDRVDIALAANADGVHLGQHDIPAIDARRILGRDAIIGVSTHNIEQARAAQRDGADYIGVGPIFPSATKPRDILPGPAYARQVAQEIRIPAVAIAGITRENVDEVLATGIGRIAVAAAVAGAQDVRAAARALKEKIAAA